VPTKVPGLLLDADPTTAVRWRMRRAAGWSPARIWPWPGRPGYESFTGRLTLRCGRPLDQTVAAALEPVVGAAGGSCRSNPAGL
jgi:hypothetical protein